MKINSLSVFFPAFNEQQNIESTVKQAIKVLEELKLSNYEVLVVNDGSIDNTGKIVEKLAKENRHIRLINHSKNLGYGHALKTGFENSKFEWVAFADSDGQFDFSEINKLLEYTDQADYILGYRIHRADPFIRSAGTFVWTLMAKALLGLPARDYSCGFKLIKKSAFDAILPLQAGEKVTQIEMLVKAKRKGFRFAEVPVHHFPRRFGQQTGANLKVVLKSYADLLRLWQTLH